MAVSSVTPLPKSQPDVSKLNTFTGYVVTVTKHLGPRGTVGTAIVSSKVMTKEALLALPDTLPAMPGAGPGYYSFTVTDAGGTGDDTWLVKLGPDLPSQQQEFSMAGPMNGATPPNGFVGTPNVPMDGAAVTQILPGWFYNSQMGLLYTPWRETVAWNSGDALPKPPAQAAQHLVPPPSQWGAGAPPSQFGWGGFPVNDSESSKVRQLEAQIVENTRRQEMEALRSDQRRQADETNKRIEQQQTNFMQMFERLTTAISEISKAPKGPSDEVVALREQIARDRQERDARERDTQLREEMRRNREDSERVIRELSANKSDPMMPMLMQVMQTSNQNAMEAIKAIQSSTGAASTSAERQVQQLVEQMRGTIMSPVQLMQMISTAKGEGADMAKMMLETTKDTMSMQRNVFEQLLEVAGSGSQPAWLQAVEALANKVGPIGEALAARASQPKVVVQRVAVPVDAATGRPIQTPPPVQSPALSGAAGAPAAPGTTKAEFRPGAQPEVEVIPPTAKRGRKKKGDAPKELTMAQIREMDPDELFEQIKPLSDEMFFGETLFGFVTLLRENVEKGMLPEQVAGTLWDRRNELAALTPVPGAVELFMAEQISVLVDRLLPDADDAFREKLVDGIEERIEAEAEGKEE